MQDCGHLGHLGHGHFRQGLLGGFSSSSISWRRSTWSTSFHFATHALNNGARATENKRTFVLRFIFQRHLDALRAFSSHFFWFKVGLSKSSSHHFWLFLECNANRIHDLDIFCFCLFTPRCQAEWLLHRLNQVMRSTERLLWPGGLFQQWFLHMPTETNSHVSNIPSRLPASAHGSSNKSALVTFSHADGDFMRNVPRLQNTDADNYIKKYDVLATNFPPRSKDEYDVLNKICAKFGKYHNNIQDYTLKETIWSQFTSDCSRASFWLSKVHEDFERIEMFPSNTKIDTLRFTKSANTDRNSRCIHHAGTKGPETFR